MKRLLLIALGITILMLPATSDAGRRIKMCDSDNASQFCFLLEEMDPSYDFVSHGDCVSYYQPYFNEKCGNGDAADIAESCKFYMRCEDEGYCDSDNKLEEFICKLICWGVHIKDPPCSYWYKNVGECVSDFRANND